MESFFQLVMRLVLIVVVLIIICLVRFFNPRVIASLFNWNVSIKGKIGLISLCFSILVGYLFFKEFPALDSTLQIMLLTTIFVVQAFFEEIAFRGIIFGLALSLIDKVKVKEKRMRYIAIALLIQSSIFAVLHLQFGILQMSLRFLTGIIYGLIFIFSKRNILPSTAAHLVYNYVVFLLGRFGF